MVSRWRAADLVSTDIVRVLLAGASLSVHIMTSCQKEARPFAPGCNVGEAPSCSRHVSRMISRLGVHGVVVYKKKETPTFLADSSRTAMHMCFWKEYTEYTREGLFYAQQISTHSLLRLSEGVWQLCPSAASHLQIWPRRVRTAARRCIRSKTALEQMLGFRKGDTSLNSYHRRSNQLVGDLISTTVSWLACSPLVTRCE